MLDVEPTGLGALCIVHLTPPQCSTSSRWSANPTAVQLVRDKHETARRELYKSDLRGGVLVIAQRLPRQTSARVIQRFDASTSVPTAMQKLRFAHDTPLR
jgi:hypothetical protein